MSTNHCLPLVVTLVCCIGLIACSDQIVDESVSNSVSSNTNSSSKADNVTDLPPVPVLSPVYRWTISSELVVETLESGDTETVNASVSGLANVDQTDAGIVLTLSTCVAEFPDNDDCKLVIPRKTIESVPTLTTAARFEYVEDQQAYLMAIQESAMVAGANLEEPFTEALPMDEDDERLTDTDSDGEIGVTLMCSGFELYAALRLIISPEALSRTDEPGWRGATALNLQVSVVDDNVPFVNVQKKLDAALEEIRIAGQDNYLSLTPVTEQAVEATCQTVYHAQQERSD